MSKERKPLVAVCPCTVNGLAFERGSVLGEIDGDDKLYPVQGVTVGHLEARLRLGVLQVGPLEEEPTPVPQGGGGGDEPTPLPEDFPGRVALVNAGHETVEAVAGLEPAALLTINGIAQPTADKIAEALVATNDAT